MRFCFEVPYTGSVYAMVWEALSNYGYFSPPVSVIVITLRFIEKPVLFQTLTGLSRN